MAFTVMQVLEKLLRDVTNLQKENSEIKFKLNTSDAYVCRFTFML